MLIAKTPAEEGQLWNQNSRMAGELGMDWQAARKRKLVVWPESRFRPSVVLDQRQSAMEVRAGRVAFLHLTEHLKLRSMLDAFDKYLQMVESLKLARTGEKAAVGCSPVHEKDGSKWEGSEILGVCWRGFWFVVSTHKSMHFEA